MIRYLVVLILALGVSLAQAEPDVIILHTPEAGIQPVAQADEEGNIHLIYFRGDAAHGDIYYALRPRNSDKFADPVKVNSIDGSAVAMGTIRGAQMALGRSGHIHVAWMGSSEATPDGDHHRTPMFYTRSTDGGKTFALERNLITESYGLDGGGSVAANANGKVEVYWHAGAPDSGEGGRKIWVARSIDDGLTFAPEFAAWDEKTGVCGCCGMTAGASGDQFSVLYRSATDQVHRDIYLLHSDSGTGEFTGKKLDEWRTATCPMSAMSLSFSKTATAAAWETEAGGIAYTIAGSSVGGSVPRRDVDRKFPSIALAPDGQVLLTWIDGGGWRKEGHLAWQLFTAEGHPIDEPQVVGTSALWTKPAAVYANGSFVIIH